MMDLVLGVLNDKRLQTLLALIALDLLLGVAAALKAGRFDWAKTGEFYQKTVLPIFIGYFALRLALPYVAVETLGATGEWLGEVLVSGFWLAGCGTLLASMAKSVKELIGKVVGGNDAGD